MKKFIVLSAEIAGSDRNEDRTENMYAALSAHPFHVERVTGYYKGVKETSFIVTIPDFINGTNWRNNVKPVLTLAFKAFQQESVLYNFDDIGMLIYSDGRVEALGKYTELPIQEAAGMEAYTVLNDKAFYYISN